MPEENRKKSKKREGKPSTAVVRGIRSRTGKGKPSSAVVRGIRSRTGKGKPSSAVVRGIRSRTGKGKPSTAVASRRHKKAQVKPPLPYCVFRFRRMTATIRIPQKTKKTDDTTKTGTQPTVKTSVKASAVTIPPPMKGS